MVQYYLTRAHGNLQLLEQLDLVGRTGELAKLFGIQFSEVLTRGSQFRVESMMLRLARRRNYLATSPRDEFYENSLTRKLILSKRKGLLKVLFS